MLEEKCMAKHCRNESTLYYYKRPLCDKHWAEYCKLPLAKMKKLLDISKKEEGEINEGR